MRIEGYVIVSAEGHLTDASGVMPDALKFDGDLAFFTAGLDRADLVVHGKHSFEDQPNSPRRPRIVMTRQISAVAPDASNAKATLWNPAGAPFESACEAAGVRSGTAAIIGGPTLFAMFLDRYDTFWLSQAPHVTLPGGEFCFAGYANQTPQTVLAGHGLRAGEVRVLDADHDVTVTAWRR